jgi:hypothetical protein
MAPRGPAPKPAHLRQRTNKKTSHATIEAPDQSVAIPPIPNPDGREWHPLTLKAWEHAWRSPMASQWLETDKDALGRVALLWDQFYNRPSAGVMAEIRLQEQRFGLSPLDRSRLQWEVNRADQAETARQKRTQPPAVVGDPRKLLRAVPKS